MNGYNSGGFSLQSINISMTCNISTHYEKERQRLPFLFSFPKQLTEPNGNQCSMFFGIH